MYSATVNKIDAALNKYYERFGENYPLGISEVRTTDEIISDIERCIETGDKAEEPLYEEYVDYQKEIKSLTVPEEACFKAGSKNLVHDADRCCLRPMP